MSKFLHRDDAPFGEAVWAQIDETVVQAAKSRLTARRLLSTDGPFGLGLKALPGADQVVDAPAEGGVRILAADTLPLATIAAEFSLARRDLAAFEERGAMLNLTPVAEAALACARQEDDLLFHGSKALGVDGLFTAKGAESHKLNEWSAPGKASDDLIAAVTRLDHAGFHGPYALALAPDRYNLLFRRYESGNTTEMEHLRGLIADGILKAPALKTGGVLIATGRQYASIVLGQDLAAGFVGPAGQEYQFTLSETLALRLQAPASVCALK